jgi:tetratricopeptide (TPR) repeat protein
VLSDPKLSAQMKFRAIQKFRRLESTSSQPSQISAKGAQSPAVESKGNTDINYGVPPLDWAQTQLNLGSALSALGQRESGTAPLEAAVAAYQAVLEELTRSRVPLDWAHTQLNLGSALSALGERESGTAHLEAAVAAWQACLTVTAAAWPQAWVRSVQSDIDQAHTEIAQRAAAARCAIVFSS